MKAEGADQKEMIRERDSSKIALLIDFYDGASERWREEMDGRHRYASGEQSSPGN